MLSPVTLNTLFNLNQTFLFHHRLIQCCYEYFITTDWFILLLPLSSISATRSDGAKFYDESFDTIVIGHMTPRVSNLGRSGNLIEMGSRRNCKVVKGKFILIVFKVWLAATSMIQCVQSRGALITAVCIHILIFILRWDCFESASQNANLPTILKTPLIVKENTVLLI